MYGSELNTVTSRCLCVNTNSLIHVNIKSSLEYGNIDLLLKFYSDFNLNNKIKI